MEGVLCTELGQPRPCTPSLPRCVCVCVCERGVRRLEKLIIFWKLFKNLLFLPLSPLSFPPSLSLQIKNSLKHRVKSQDDFVILPNKPFSAEGLEEVSLSLLFSSLLFSTFLSPSPFLSHTHSPLTLTLKDKIYLQIGGITVFSKDTSTASECTICMLYHLLFHMPNTC